MIAIDTNLLVYAHRRESTFHRPAAALMRGLAEGARPWAIPWPCVYEFLSVVTNVRIWNEVASSPTQALSQLDAWRRAPTTALLAETAQTWDITAELVAQPRVRGGVVHDARIAAVCLSHSVEALWSADRDFALFPSLVVHDPLRSR